MNNFFYLFVFFVSLNLANSQIYEIGVFGGGSNFVGDIGSTTFLAPKKLAIGGLIKWNRSPRHSYRISVIYTSIFANDILSSDPKRQDRGYFFNAKALDISAGIEFTFLDFDLHKNGLTFSPYIYTGLSMLNHPNFYFGYNELIPEKTRSLAYGIPIALGAKLRLSEHFIIGLEITSRYTLSDEIDGSVPDNPELNFAKFGNINNNDWYMFSGLTLTYTFGRNPCYCSY